MLFSYRLLFLLGIVLSINTVYPQAVTTSRKKAGTLSDPENIANKDLSDKDRHLSKTFVNEALGNKIIREECAKLKDPLACQGMGSTKFLGVDSETVKMVAKAYSMLMGTMGVQGGGGALGGIKMKTPAEGSEGKDFKKDYCVMIGAGAESVGLVMQQTSTKTLSLPEGGETDQKDTLYRAARAHKDRAKTAKIQAAGWGGATACYAYMMTMGGGDLKSFGNIAKLSAAGLLTGFYFSENKQHTDHADTVRAIAEKLPGKGDCNPVSQPNCYCSLPEYANDPKYCLPKELHRNKIKKSAIRVACTDKNLKADPSCSCLQNDSCFDMIVDKGFSGSADLGGNAFLSSPVGQDIKSLARGELREGALTSDGTQKNAGLANLLRKRGKDIPDPKKALSAAEIKTADNLSRFGLPPQLARHLVAAANPPGMAANIKRFQGATIKRASGGALSGKPHGQVLTFRGGKGTQKKKAQQKSGFNFNKYLNRGKKKSRGSKNEILTFGERAVSSAEIIKDDRQNIFRIISRRYILTSSKRL